MRKIHIIAFCTLFPLCVFAEQNKPRRDSKSDRDTILVAVQSYIHHISDINIKDQEYQIEIWLNLFSNKPLTDTLADQIQVKDAKKVEASFIPQYKEYKAKKDKTIRSLHIFKDKDTSFYRRVLKVNCTMIQKWNLEGFPFDEQTLDIVIYTIRPIKYFRFIPVDTSFSHSFKITDTLHINGKKYPRFDVENGWYFISDTVHSDTAPEIFDSTKIYSALHYKIPIYRTDKLSLFLKLFLGMYAAVIVAIIALFIAVEHEEPRFGLPVGGLFAAIANKYIIESLLPPSPDFTLVDNLHTVSVFYILIVLFYSAILLVIKKNKKYNDKKYKKFDERVKWGIIISFFVINFIFLYLRWN